MLRKNIRILCLLICFMFILVSLPLQVQAGDELKTAVQCSFVIPKDFLPGEEQGLFINKNYPMESSSILYSYYDNGKDRVLTNREKLENAQSGEKLIVDESTNLTREIFEETTAAAYSKAYGKNVGYKVSSFKKIKIDGYPGFCINADYQVPDEEKIYQTTYIIISRYRTFTVTYQRAEDDDCEELFDSSAATIHVR